MQFPVGCFLQIWQKWNLCLQLINDCKKTSIADELCYHMFCHNKQKKTKCFHQQLIVYFNIWSNQTTKHSCGVMPLKLCRILNQWGSWMDEERGASCTTANHKSTSTSKPSQWLRRKLWREYLWRGTVK